MSTSDPNGGAPNAFVAQNATQAELIPLDQVALIGVSGKEGDMKAILRMGDGSIISGKQGERIEIGRLVEVAAAGVVVGLENGNAAFLRPYPFGQTPVRVASAATPASLRQPSPSTSTTSATGPIPGDPRIIYGE